MNPEPPRQGTAWASLVGILGALLIFSALVWAMRHYTQPMPLGEDRAAVRAKTLAELRAAEAQALTTPAWIDKTKGLVHLPVEDAMKIIEREWGQNPAAARSNLIAREEKANPPPPPRAPEKPSQFE